MNFDQFKDTSAGVLADWRPEHSPIQLEHFVIGSASHGTPWGRYTQACRELQARYEGVRNYELELDEKKLALDEAQLDLREAEDEKRSHLAIGGSQPESECEQIESSRFELAVRKAELAVRRAKCAWLATIDRRGELEREASVALEHAYKARVELMPGGFKEYLTEERRLDLEWDFWAARFLDKIVFARIVGLPLPDEIIMGLRRFPDEHREKLAYALQVDTATLELEHAPRLGLTCERVQRLQQPRK